VIIVSLRHLRQVQSNFYPEPFILERKASPPLSSIGASSACHTRSSSLKQNVGRNPTVGHWVSVEFLRVLIPRKRLGSTTTTTFELKLTKQTQTAKNQNYSCFKRSWQKLEHSIKRVEKLVQNQKQIRFKNGTHRKQIGLLDFHLLCVVLLRTYFIVCKKVRKTTISTNTVAWASKMLRLGSNDKKANWNNNRHKN